MTPELCSGNLLNNAESHSPPGSPAQKLSPSASPTCSLRVKRGMNLTLTFLLVVVFFVVVRPTVRYYRPLSSQYRSPSTPYYPGPLSDLPWEQLARELNTSPGFIQRAAKGHLNSKEADALALQSIKSNPRAFTAIIAPKAYPWLHQIIDELNYREGKVLYLKPVYLHYHGAKRLLSLQYGELKQHRPMEWVTKPWKLHVCTRERFGHPYPMYAVYVDFPSQTQAKAAKDYIRQTLDIGVSGIHIVDCHWEAVRLAEIVLDDTRIDHLNAY